MTDPAHLRVMLEFYSRMTGQTTHNLSDIPADKLAFLSSMGFINMARPVAIWALRDGVPLKSVSDWYGIDRRTLYRWKRRYSL